MVLNGEKSFFMSLEKDTENKDFYFEDIIIEKKEEVKILGVTIDEKLSFNSHIKTLCMKVSQKLGALSRMSHCLSKTEKSLIFNSMIKSHFNYCPLWWMFCSWTPNNRINKLHERSLRVIHNDESNDFNTLLEMNNEVTIDKMNIQVLMLKVFKIKNGLARPILNLLTTRSNKLRHFQKYDTETKKPV